MSIIGFVASILGFLGVFTPIFGLLYVSVRNPRVDRALTILSNAILLGIVFLTMFIMLLLYIVKGG